MLRFKCSKSSVRSRSYHSLHLPHITPNRSPVSILKIHGQLMPSGYKGGAI